VAFLKRLLRKRKFELDNSGIIRALAAPAQSSSAVSPTPIGIGNFVKPSNQQELGLYGGASSGSPWGGYTPPTKSPLYAPLSSANPNPTTPASFAGPPGFGPSGVSSQGFGGGTPSWGSQSDSWGGGDSAPSWGPKQANSKGFPGSSGKGQNSSLGN
jgi:hypothetical protein